MSRFPARSVTIGGVTKTIPQWARESGVTRRTIADRIAKGVPPERLLSRAWSSHEHACKHELWPGANTLSYEDDRMAQVMVSEFGGMTLDQVGLCLGLTYSRIEQIERVALKKLLSALRDEGLERAFRDWLRERDAAEPRALEEAV